MDGQTNCRKNTGCFFSLERQYCTTNKRMQKDRFSVLDLMILVDENATSLGLTVDSEFFPETRRMRAYDRNFLRFRCCVCLEVLLEDRDFEQKEPRLPPSVFVDLCNACIQRAMPVKPHGS